MVLPLLPLVVVSVLAVPLLLLPDPVVPLAPALGVVVVSVLAPALGVLGVVVLPVPLAPMLLPLEPAAPLEPLDPAVPLAPVVPPALPLVLGEAVLSVLEEPEPAVLEPEVPLPEVCATANPPRARAAAAARVVRVFLLVVMSCSLKWKPRRE